MVYTPATGPAIGPTSFSFEGINWKRVLMGILAAAVGAICTAITAAIGHIDWSQLHIIVMGMDFGSYVLPAVQTGWTAIAIVIRKWVSDNE